MSFYSIEPDRVGSSPLAYLCSLSTDSICRPSSCPGHYPEHYGYYGGSVAMRVSPCRRSRLYAHQTFSVFRPLVRFLPPFVIGYSPERAFVSLPVRLTISHQKPTLVVFRCYRFRHAPFPFGFPREVRSGVFGGRLLSTTGSCGAIRCAPRRRTRYFSITYQQ
jgi:hypothetical protein